MNDAKTLAAPNLIAANDMLKVNGLKLNHQSKKYISKGNIRSEMASKNNTNNNLKIKCSTNPYTTSAIDDYWKESL